MLIEMEYRGNRAMLGQSFEIAVRRRLMSEGLCFERLPTDRKTQTLGRLEHWPGTGGSVAERLFYGNKLQGVLSGCDLGNGKMRADVNGRFYIPASVLYVPNNHAFPAADFFFEQGKGVWVVQVTVSKRKKPSGAYENLLKQLRDCNKTVLGIVWVVNVDADPARRVILEKRLVIDQEKRSRLFNNTPQYVCKVDYRKNMQWAAEVTVGRAPRVVWFHTSDGVREVDSYACKALKASRSTPLKRNQKFKRISSVDDGPQHGDAPTTAFRFKATASKG